MAVTHTEVYRRYDGELHPRRFPWWPIAAADVRIAWKKKLPILLLYIPVGIATIVHCFQVYAAFMLGETVGPMSPAQMVVAAIAEQLLTVRGIMSQFNLVVGNFSVLVMTWFGAGLIAEDKRANAHLLYFARPIRRFDYVIAKLAAVGFWGVCTSLLSSLLICLVAVFTSPDWIFLTDQYETIFLTIAYSCTWIITVSSITLAISSVMPRKTFALIAIIAFFTLSGIISTLLAHVTDQPNWGVLSPFACFNELRHWIFASAKSRGGWSEVWPFASAVIVFCVGSWSLIALRVRRLEVVA